MKTERGIATERGTESEGGEDRDSELLYIRLRESGGKRYGER